MRQQGHPDPHDSARSPDPAHGGGHDPDDGDADSGNADDGDAGGGEPPLRTRDAQVRLAPGQLRTKVADHLRAHPDAELSPYQISRALGGHSAGAVANALDKLVHVGDVELVSEKPRRYRAPNR